MQFSTKARTTYLILLLSTGALKIVEAQPVYHRYDSLETRVAKAESVLRGSIAQLSRIVVVPPGGTVTNEARSGERRVQYQTQKPDGLVEYICTVRVREVIKGPPRKIVDVLFQTDGSDKRLDQWNKERTPFLWFLDETSPTFNQTNRPPYWNAIRLGPRVAAEKGYSSAPPVFSMDFTRLEDADDILARVRTYARRRTHPTTFHTFHFIPRETFSAELTVPVDPTLERLASRLILQPGDFTVRSLQNQLRHEGLQALRYFKSAENVRVVRSFLQDPMESYAIVGSGDAFGSTIRRYPARSTAYQILREWGIAVEKPVVEERDSILDRSLWSGGWHPDNRPCGIVADGAGNLFVSDNHNSIIRLLSPIGTNWEVRAIAGEGVSDHMPRRENRLCQLAVDTRGTIFVADSFRSIVRKLTLAGTNWVLVTIAGRTGEKGSADGWNDHARFEEPSAIATDRAGNIYVADAGNSTIRRIAPSGTNWSVTTIAGDAAKRGAAVSTNLATRISYPRGLAVDGNGDIYVANSGDHNIKKISLMVSNWVVTTIAGDGLAGHVDGANSSARFSNPAGIAIDADGNLFVTDSFAIVRMMTRRGTNWLVRTIAGTRPPVAERKINHVDGTNQKACFYHPQGLAVDDRANVYVADTLNSAIRKLVHQGTNWVVSTLNLRPADGVGSPSNPSK